MSGVSSFIPGPISRAACRILFSGLLVAWLIFAQSTTTDPPSERYEVLKTDSEINILQQTYNLTRIVASPTHAAFQPGWPETLITILVWVLTFAALRYGGSSDGPETKPSLWLSVLPSVLSIAWIPSFAIVQYSKRTAGWVSVTIWLTSFGISIAVDHILAIRVGGRVLAIFQWAASLVVIIQRWRGGIGTVAYEIHDSLGCVPTNGNFAFLEAGVRSRAFRIIQTFYFVWMTSWLVVLLNLINSKNNKSRDLMNRANFSYVAGRYDQAERLAAEADRQKVSFGYIKEVKFGMGMNIISCIVPVLIYEIKIATLGRPVAISGSCMLVEADPKVGFFDIEINNYWKGLVGLTGL